MSVRSAGGVTDAWCVLFGSWDGQRAWLLHVSSTDGVRASSAESERAIANESVARGEVVAGPDVVIPEDRAPPPK